MNRLTLKETTEFCFHWLVQLLKKLTESMSNKFRISYQKDICKTLFYFSNQIHPKLGSKATKREGVTLY